MTGHSPIVKFAMISAIIVLTPMLAVAQRGYYIYTQNNEANSRFMNLEQFRVGGSEPTDSVYSNIFPLTSQDEQQETEQDAPYVPERIQPGIKPNLMGQAISTKQLNLQFMEQAQYSYEQHCSPLQTVTWRTPNFSHRTLYFEDPNLERYGLNKGHLQPVYSAGRFFGTVAILPYAIAKRSPNCCTGTIGHARPGNCAPAMRRQFRVDSPRGLAAEVLIIGTILAAM